MMLPEGITPRIYRISPWRRAVPWFIFGPVLLLFSVMLFSPSSRDIGLVLMAFMLLVALGVHWLVSYMRLEVSPIGVRVRNLGQTVETVWPNVIDIRLDRGKQGLITREPLEGKGAARMAAYSGVTMNGVPMYDDQQRRLLDARRLIPIDPFAWHLKHGDLAAEIGHVAPHLQLPEKMAAALLPKPPALPRTPEQRRKEWLFWMSTAAILLMVAALAIFVPGVFKHAENLVWCVFLPFSALQAGIGAWNSFRKGAVFLGICLVLSTLMLACFFFVLFVSLVSGH